MKRVISFTIYKAPKQWEVENQTSFPKYINGFLENLKLIKILYPQWYIFLYHDKSFDKALLGDAILYEKLELKEINNNGLAAMQWRFLPNDDNEVELFIVRDADSRITTREVASVNEWINSSKKIHIMRDHPHHHYKILGGMWGLIRQEDLNMELSCYEYNKSKGFNENTDWYGKWWDMNFLGDVIYPKYINESYINATYHKYEPWAKNFTETVVDGHFIGEIFTEENNRAHHHKIL